VLQDVFIGIDALRDVDRHDEGEVDRLRRGRPHGAAGEQSGEPECESADDQPHRMVMPPYCGALAAAESQRPAITHQPPSAPGAVARRAMKGVDDDAGQAATPAC